PVWPAPPTPASPITTEGQEEEEVDHESTDSGAPGDGGGSERGFPRRTHDDRWWPHEDPRRPPVPPPARAGRPAAERLRRRRSGEPVLTPRRGRGGWQPLAACPRRRFGSNAVRVIRVRQPLPDPPGLAPVCVQRPAGAGRSSRGGRFAS